MNNDVAIDPKNLSRFFSLFVSHTQDQKSNYRQKMEWVIERFY